MNYTSFGLQCRIEVSHAAKQFNFYEISMGGRFNPERQLIIGNSFSFSSETERSTTPTKGRALTKAIVKRWIAESNWALT